MVILEVILECISHCVVVPTGNGCGFVCLIPCALWLANEEKDHQNQRMLAPVVRKPISANPRLNRPNPRNKFIL